MTLTKTERLILFNQAVILLTLGSQVHEDLSKSLEQQAIKTLKITKYTEAERELLDPLYGACVPLDFEQLMKRKK